MGLQFFKQDEQTLNSREDKKFVLSKMEGDYIKSDKTSLFINIQSSDEQSKGKGFSFDAKDLPAMCELLLRAKSKFVT